MFSTTSSFLFALLMLGLAMLNGCGTASDYVEATNCLAKQQSFPIENCQKILENK